MQSGGKVKSKQEAAVMSRPRSAAIVFKRLSLVSSDKARGSYA